LDTPPENGSYARRQPMEKCVPDVMDAQSELVAQQTVTMALAQTLIDMTVELVQNTGDIGLLDAVIETMRDQVSAISKPFVLPGQPLLDIAQQERTMVLFKERADSMTDLVEMACKARMVGDSGPKN
jgi:hypothetical protein